MLWGMIKISIFKNFRQIFGAFLFSYGISSVFFTDILFAKKQDGSTNVPMVAIDIMRDHEDTRWFIVFSRWINYFGWNWSIELFRAFFNYERNEFEHPVEHLNAFINFEYGYIWPVLHKPSNCTRIQGFNQTTVLIGKRAGQTKSKLDHRREISSFRDWET